MDAVTLPPDLQRFADDAIAQGRYADMSAVVRAGLGLLQHAEAERLAFIASLEDAEAEAEREGYFTAEDVRRDMDAIIEAVAHRLA